MDGVKVYATQEEADADAQKREDAATKKRQDELVALARKRFAMAEEAESEIRRHAAEDIRFRAGEQWDTQILRDRQIERRPALVINRMPQFERQITNEQRQARPAIQVSPIDSQADVDTAEVLQGLIRHIEYDSNADVAYDTSLTSAVRGGFGYFRAITEFESEQSFDQCLKIKRVRDPFSVYMDPCAQEPDGSDADWAFVVGDGLSEEQFRKDYPDCEPVSGGWGSQYAQRGSTCQVVEYFYRERIEDELIEVEPFVLHPQTGQPTPVGPPVTGLRSTYSSADLARLKILNSRPTHTIKVRWAKIAGANVVDETEFPSKWIPVVPVLGDELWVDGKRILEGVVRNAKDPQRMYNFWATAITETVALAPKAPFIGYEGQFAGKEKKWAEAMTKNVPFLEVRATTLTGQPAPLPQRNSFDAPIGAMTQALGLASEDMKATTGIYDAALGNRSNEQTGVAIRARQGQSQTSTMHFSDNLARAMRHLGRILLDAIPRVYSQSRVVRILGEDQSEKMVAVNGHAPVEGQERPFDLDVGRYDVAVSMGPSYASKRQEAVAAALELSRGNPQIAQAISDIMVRNMDWPGAQEMADRLKKMLPPGIAEPDGNQGQDPAIMAQQLQQAQAMIGQLSQAVHAAHDQLDTKSVENMSKERIALIQAQVDLTKTAAQINSAEAQAILDHSVALIQKRLELDGIDQPPISTTPVQGTQPQGAPNGSGSPTPRVFSAGPSGPAPGAPGGPSVFPGPGPFNPGGPGGAIP